MFHAMVDSSIVGLSGGGPGRKSRLGGMIEVDGRDSGDAGFSDSGTWRMGGLWRGADTS